MSVTPTADAPTPPEAKKPFYKNPFVLAFVLGIAILTVLPFLQRTTLRAPPPLSRLPADWSLKTGDGKPFGAADLAGKVWIGQVCVAPCNRLEVSLASVAKHVEDVADRVKLVTVAIPPQLNAGEALPSSPTPGWTVVTGTAEEVEAVLQPVREGLARQPRETPVASAVGLAQANKFVLVDQTGAVRGFWTGDELGKGNVINAARMLARHGPNP